MRGKHHYSEIIILYVILYPVHSGGLHEQMYLHENDLTKGINLIRIVANDPTITTG